jgi:hypothetical protein
MLEIEFGVDRHMAWSVEEVRDAGEQIAILFGDLIQPSEVNAKTE